MQSSILLPLFFTNALADLIISTTLFITATCAFYSSLDNGKLLYLVITRLMLCSKLPLIALSLLTMYTIFVRMYTMTASRCVSKLAMSPLLIIDLVLPLTLLA
jgi:hypothetical protein